MEVALIIIAAGLLVLIGVVTLKGRGARQTARKHEIGEARAIAEKGAAQHDRSLARRVEVRAAQAERGSNARSDTDEQ